MIAKGSLVQHNIQRTKRPVITEISKMGKPIENSISTITELNNNKTSKEQNSIVLTSNNSETESPKYLLICEPETFTEFIIIQIELPNLVHKINFYLRNQSRNLRRLILNLID